MKIEIIETFIGYPHGVEKPEQTFIAGSVVDVGEAFGKAIIEKGHARYLTGSSHFDGPNQPEDTNETE